MEGVEGDNVFELQGEFRARSNTWPLPRPDNLNEKDGEKTEGMTVVNEQSQGSPPSDITVGGQPPKKSSARRNAWGNMSYADLITQAIQNSQDKRLTLSQIYDWMVQNVPYFKDKGDSNSSAGWKNSIRHNLSLHSRFMRIQNEGTGKSSWWVINPDAKPGKSTRRRATSMETQKYEKKRGRVRKKVEALRNGSDTSSISPPSTVSEGLDTFPESPSHLGFQLSPDFRPRASSNASSCGRLSPIPAVETDMHDSQVPRLSPIPWIPDLGLFMESSTGLDRYCTDQLGNSLAETVKLGEGDMDYQPKNQPGDSSPAISPLSSSNNFGLNNYQYNKQPNSDYKAFHSPVSDDKGLTNLQPHQQSPQHSPRLTETTNFQGLPSGHSNQQLPTVLSALQSFSPGLAKPQLSVKFSNLQCASADHSSQKQVPKEVSIQHLSPGHSRLQQLPVKLSTLQRLSSGHATQHQHSTEMSTVQQLSPGQTGQQQLTTELPTLHISQEELTKKLAIIQALSTGHSNEQQLPQSDVSLDLSQDNMAALTSDQLYVDNFLDGSSTGQIPGQLVSLPHQNVLPNDLDLNMDMLDMLHGDLECDVDQVIRHELSVDGNLDFNFEVVNTISTTTNTVTSCTSTTTPVNHWVH